MNAKQWWSITGLKLTEIKKYGGNKHPVMIQLLNCVMNYFSPCSDATTRHLLRFYLLSGRKYFMASSLHRPLVRYTIGDLPYVLSSATSAAVYLCTLVHRMHRNAAISKKPLFFLVAAFILLVNIVFAQTASNKFPALIPLPVELTETNESFHIRPSTRIVSGDSSLNQSIDLFNLYLSANTGKHLVITSTTPAGNYILVNIDTTKVKYEEGYHLLVTGSHIQLTGHDAGGVVYGMQTLRQLWQHHSNNLLNIPGCIINDHPRFAYRGMSLDVGRRLFPVTFIKKYIDLLSLYKFNIFHWHLTEDQGWRIEIKKYPKLQSVAAWRSETMIGHKKELPHRFNGKRYGGYYTKEEVKEIVRYAAQRNITIIPEIEMPGHALAALTAYPSLGCTGGPYKTATFWGIFNEVYCAGNDSTFIFLENVLDEVMQLFPSMYIHIGGDECPKTRWKLCPKCQQRIRELGLKDEHALQSYFIQRIEKYINKRGRSIIGWDEILEGGLAPDATVMSWRGEEGGIAAAQQRHAVVMTPESHLYFDYYQSLYADEPLAAGGYTPLSKVYAYEPAGDSINAEIKSYIKGVEGQAWSEYYTGTAKAEYMIFPRALALAELAWTPKSLRNYTNFLERLRNHQPLLAQLKVHAAGNFDEIQFAATAKSKNLIEVSLQSSLPGSRIHFTSDGTIPSLKTTLYTKPFELTKSSELRAMLFDDQQKAVGRIFQQRFTMHKGVGASVTLTNKPVERFNPGAAALGNGIFGTNLYNDNQWLGFSGENLEAVIDLGSVLAIHSVGMRFLNYHWQRMWPPVVLEVFVSTDSANFIKVYSQKEFTVNGINRVSAQIKRMKARYIKVTGINKGIIPVGEYGAGTKALLLIDEIIVD